MYDGKVVCVSEDGKFVVRISENTRTIHCVFSRYDFESDLRRELEGLRSHSLYSYDIDKAVSAFRHWKQSTEW